MTWHDDIEGHIKKNVEVGGEFTIEDVYAIEEEMARLYPKNQHIRDTIRDVLQSLREEGFIDFLAAGRGDQENGGRYRRTR